MKAKLLDDLVKDLIRVSEGRYVNDADEYGDYWVPAKGSRGDLFAALHQSAKVDVLAEEIDWESYKHGGLTWRQTAKIVWNILDGHPRERWLEGGSFRAPHVRPRPAAAGTVAFAAAEESRP